MLAGGVAPIKEEFLIPKPEPQKVDGAEKNNEKFGKKRRRGQNKKREKPFFVKQQCRVCQFIIRGEECPFGEKCNKIHDVKVYMDSKEPDLGEKCVIFDSFGKCCYGIACRFASSHLDENFKNVIDDAKMEKMKIYEVKQTLPKDLQNKLRARDVIFSRSDKFLTDNGIEYISEIEAKKSKNESDAKRIAKENYKKLRKAAQNGDQNSVEDADKPKEAQVEEAVKEEISQQTDCTEYYTLHGREKRPVDFTNKLFLAPLTTVGNLPFRRVCKEFGADITCGEMAMCDELLKAQMSEWALLKRHHTEDLFGVQICGSSVVKVAKTCEMINSECDVDFIDLNVGCPIDLVFNKGAGSSLMDRPLKLVSMVEGMVAATDIPITLKMRIGTTDKHHSAVKLSTRLKETGVSLLTVHGRTRQQRYTRKADWGYISQCGIAARPVPLYGNGDILSYNDYNDHTQAEGISGVMIARGALIKPWLFQEIKEQKHLDPSSKERFEMLQKFCNYGLEHWGSDTCGVERTRHFLLEWASFLCRYIPTGVLEVLPQRINERPPYYKGRDELETLMISDKAQDWVKLTEMLLGKVPEGFKFTPKHVASSYSPADSRNAELEALTAQQTPVSA